MSVEAEMIKEAMESCFSDYDSNFTVTVTEPDSGSEDYEVEVIYQFGAYSPKHAYDFQCRLDGTDTEFCVYEDVYELVAKDNIFVNLWFREIMDRDKDKP